MLPDRYFPWELVENKNNYNRVNIGLVFMVDTNITANEFQSGKTLLIKCLNNYKKKKHLLT